MTRMCQKFIVDIRTSYSTVPYKSLREGMKEKKKLTCVKVVASAMTNGTFTNRAKDFARSVLPILQFAH